jgi:hypothetical protein
LIVDVKRYYPVWKCGCRIEKKNSRIKRKETMKLHQMERGNKEEER